MTEHSIEELKREYSAAQSRVTAAQDAAREAKKRLDTAKLQATGLANHLVSYERASWRDDEVKEVRFVVRKMDEWGDGVSGFIVKKDGTLGEREGRHSIKGLTDHGLYVEPQP